MSREGAVLGNYLIPEEDFISLFTSILLQNKERIHNILNLVELMFSQGNIKAGVMYWEQFQTEILGNEKTKILAILNMSYENEKTEWVFSDELSALDLNGHYMSTLIKANGSIQKAQQISHIANHLHKMLNTINYTHLSYTKNSNDPNAGEANYLFYMKKNDKKFFPDLIKRLGVRTGNKQSYTYRRVIYGESSQTLLKNATARGKATDAFLNHLGKMHSSVFNTNDTLSLINSDDKYKQTVKQEEDNARQYGFLHLLLESLNSIPWYTGGDLILVDIHGKVLCNLQLKTSINDYGSISTIATRELSKWIHIINKQLEQSDEKEYRVIAKQFFDNLKTSGQVEDMGDDVITSSYKMVENILKAKNIL